MLVVLFAITQALGLWIGKQILISPEPLASTPALGQDDIWLTVIIFSLFFFLVTFILFSLLRKMKSGILFRVLFFLALLMGLEVFFYIFLSSFLALLLSIIILLVQKFYSRIWLHNLILVISLAGLGSSVGISVQTKAVIIIMIILSVWDFIAVFKTKQMVVMFKSLVKKGAPLALIIPKNKKDFNTRALEFDKEKYLFLGTGDVVLPLIFAGSILRESLLGAILVALGSIVGLIFLVLFQKSIKEGKPLPGLPPIVLFSLLGYLIYQLGVVMGY